jgi:hypothetical protein
MPPGFTEAEIDRSRELLERAEDRAEFFDSLEDAIGHELKAGNRFLYERYLGLVRATGHKYALSQYRERFEPLLPDANQLADQVMGFLKIRQNQPAEVEGNNWHQNQLRWMRRSFQNPGARKRCFERMKASLERECREENTQTLGRYLEILTVIDPNLGYELLERLADVLRPAAVVTYVEKVKALKDRAASDSK